MNWITALAVTAGALALNGCYSTTLQSGLPAGETKLEADARWHSGFMGGSAEVSGPYNLKQLCPQGWSEIKTETSFANGFVDIMTGNIYNPQTITVTCAATPAVARAELPQGTR